MDFYQFLCVTVMIILSSKGCHSQQQPKCGLATLNTKIVGGENSSPGSWPWQASLNTNGYVFCGGSLITNQWVLTAAHCLTQIPPNLEVLLGRYTQSSPNPTEVSRRIDEVICHPLYDSWTNDNDLCLLKLSAPVNFTQNISPICLASEGSTFYTETNIWVTGWGNVLGDGSVSLPDILQEVKLPIVGNNECKCTYRRLTDNMLCAGTSAGGKDSCQGDSGGPLVIKEGNTWVQGGVVSFGRGCGLPGVPGVYARVSNYQGWISNITGNSRPGFVTYTSTGIDSDVNFACPTTQPPIYTTGDGSIFDSGETVMHFSHFTHFTSLCALVLSLYVLVGDA